MKSLIDSYEKIQKEFISDYFHNKKMVFIKEDKTGLQGFTNKENSLILLVPEEYNIIKDIYKDGQWKQFKIKMEDINDRVDVTGYFKHDKIMVAKLNNGGYVNSKLLEYFPKCTFYQNKPRDIIIVKKDYELVGCIIPLKL